MGYSFQSVLGLIIGFLLIFYSCHIIIDEIKMLNDYEESLRNGESGDPFDQIFLDFAHLKIILASVAILTIIFLIIGILTKCRFLLIPLMCFDVILIIGQCLLLAVFHIGAINVGVELIVFCCAYMLYEDIRKAKKEPEQIAINSNQQNSPPNYGNHTNVPKTESKN